MALNVTGTIRTVVRRAGDCGDDLAPRGLSNGHVGVYMDLVTGLWWVSAKSVVTVWLGSAKLAEFVLGVRIV